MAGPILVTTEKLREESDHLKELNAQFRAKVEELVSLEGQLGASWEGEAKDAFRNAFNADKDKWENFAKVIDQFAQALTAIYEKYLTTEQNAQAIASQRNA